MQYSVQLAVCDCARVETVTEAMAATLFSRTEKMEFLLEQGVHPLSFPNIF
jgi:hypothetical protein